MLGTAKERTREPGSLRRLLLSLFRRACRMVVRLVDFHLDCGARAFRLVARVLGPLFICVALSLVSFVTYTFLVHALPQLDGGGLPGQCGITGLGLFLLFNALYNYMMSICLDPGLPPEYKTAITELGFEAQDGTSAAARQCRHCGRLKPERCHHCSVCNRCVLKMDHHCPWVNNCVGFRNYRHFCLFLLFLAASCAFVLVVLLQSGIFATFAVRTRDSGDDDLILLSLLLCASILVALCILGGFHVYLVLTNQTTIEFQTNFSRRMDGWKSGTRFRNPYDLGLVRNFQQVFGPNPFFRGRWLLSWLALPPSGDGLQFPSLHPTTI